MSQLMSPGLPLTRPDQVVCNSVGSLVAGYVSVLGRLIVLCPGVGPPARHALEPRVLNRPSQFYNVSVSERQLSAAVTSLQCNSTGTRARPCLTLLTFITECLRP